MEAVSASSVSSGPVAVEVGDLHISDRTKPHPRDGGDSNNNNNPSSSSGSNNIDINHPISYTYHCVDGVAVSVSGRKNKVDKPVSSIISVTEIALPSVAQLSGSETAIRQGARTQSDESEVDPETMWGLHCQPLEVLHEIFTQVCLQDVMRLSTTCKHLRNTIMNDDLLWRAQYLQLHDEPIKTPNSWKAELQSLKRMQRFLLEGNRLEKEERLEEVANRCLELLSQNKNPCGTKNQRFLSRLMATRSNKSCFMSRSSLFRRAGLPLDEPADTTALCQLSAKLHVYYGMEIELDMEEREMQGAQEIHPCARSRVYDLRRYNDNNYWGPFKDDGSGEVDWEKVQAIAIVLTHGLHVFSRRIHGIVGIFWDEPFQGCAAGSFQSVRSLADFTDPEPDLFADQDPYGVRGTWMRVVNFLDFHDLFAYNFQPPLTPPEQERPPIYTKEAIRLILLRLKVAKIEPAAEGDDPAMPRVYFEGTSKSLTNNWDPNANSSIRGYVRRTIHGDVRWTTFSVFGGEERWRSESVQIGGAKSARGSIGNWFDKDYDRHGPAGPTAFWKISDDVINTERGVRRPPPDPMSDLHHDVPLGHNAPLGPDDETDETDDPDLEEESDSDPDHDHGHGEPYGQTEHSEDSPQSSAVGNIDAELADTILSEEIRLGILQTLHRATDSSDLDDNGENEEEREAEESGEEEEDGKEGEEQASSSTRPRTWSLLRNEVVVLVDDATEGGTSDGVQTGSGVDIGTRDDQS